MATKLPPIHPGEILSEDFMAPRKLTARALADKLNVPPNRISQIIRGERSITGDTALRLARYFDTTADLWMGLQLDYELRVARAAAGKRIEREVAVAPDAVAPAG